MVAIGLPLEWIRTWVDGVSMVIDLALGLVAFARWRGRI
jgi:hypothetical protein